MFSINGIRLSIETEGEGEPAVFVHGSWTDHTTWNQVVAELPAGYRLIRYDRRGHSCSERPPAQDSIRDDVADLTGVIEALAGEPAHLVGNSFGASIVLWLAGDRPDLVRSLAAHEPASFDLVASEPAVVAMREAMDPVTGLLAAGDLEGGARLFSEIVFGPGTWDEAIPDELKRVMVANAPTVLAEERDPDAYGLPTEPLARLEAPVLLSTGDETDDSFHVAMDVVALALPQARRERMPGAGHLPHRTHPAEYAALLTDFWASCAAEPPRAEVAPRDT
jgi:pimeloyl-ACP methyl ester carboxylesterase